MKRFATVALAILLLMLHLAHEAYAAQVQMMTKNAERERVLQGLLDKIGAIMQEPYDKKPGSEVRTVYLSVQGKLKADQLAWRIGDDGKKEVAAAFVPAQKGEKACLEVNHALLDAAKEHPTIAMTMILHEMKHAHDYLNIGERYKEYMKNPVEQFMYEMDSLFIEALFVRDFLKPRYKDLTNFERYVLTSLEKDNLASISAVFMKKDMDLVYDLYALGKKLDKGMACGEYFGEFTKQAKRVFGRPIPEEEFKRYNVLIGISSFTLFAAPLADGAMARNKRCKQEDHKDAIAELNGYIKRGNAVLQEQGKFIDEYASKVRRGFFVFSER